MRWPELLLEVPKGARTGTGKRVGAAREGAEALALSLLAVARTLCERELRPLGEATAFWASWLARLLGGLCSLFLRIVLRAGEAGTARAASLPVLSPVFFTQERE